MLESDRPNVGGFGSDSQKAIAYHEPEGIEMAISTLEVTRTAPPEPAMNSDSDGNVPALFPKGIPIAGRGKGKLVILSDDDGPFEDSERNTA